MVKIPSETCTPATREAMREEGEIGKESWGDSTQVEERGGHNTSDSGTARQFKYGRIPFYYK